MANRDEKVLADGAARLANAAADVLRRAKARQMLLATAESCTGGLLASLLTDIEGYSGWFDRGFVVYSNEAKSQMLGIDPIEISRHGPVSREIAVRMAEGALANSLADVAVGITGFAGPASRGDEEGLVHLAAASIRRTLHRAVHRAVHRECHFGSCGRDRARQLAVAGALELMQELIGPAQP